MVYAAAANHYDAWVGEWVELECPAATIPNGWDAAINHSYSWSVSSSKEKYITFSRKTTPTVGVTPASLFDGEITITVKHMFYLSKIVGGQVTQKQTTETHIFTLSCKKVNVSIYPSSHQMYIGDYLQIQYTYDQPNANPPASISFNSSNTSVATVSLNGTVHGESEGRCVITAQTNYGTTATCQVNILPIPVTSVSISQTNATLRPGQQVQLRATIMPFNATYQELTWSTSNSEVAAVDSDGLVVAHNPGWTEIKATAPSGVFGSCHVTVNPIEVSGLYFT